MKIISKTGCSDFKKGCCCEDCLNVHYSSGSGCTYGQPFGEDDYITECDCGE